MQKRFLILFFLSISISQGFAQFLSDEVRLSSEPLGLGARAIAMGGAAIANANDYSALNWNPAALTLLKADEINLSLYFKGHNSSAQFLGTTTENSITNFDLTSFAFASVVPTTRGHLSYGFSIDRSRDFNSTYKFSAVNSSSSFLDSRDFVYGSNGVNTNQSFANYLQDLQYTNLAWELFLTNIVDSANRQLTTPFSKGGLLQTGTVTQEGGQYAVRFGAGIDIAENISIGATLNYFTGSFDYRRVYTETDINNVFSRTDSNPPNGFQSAKIIDTKHSAQDGFSLKLGFLATPNEHLALGLTFETPTVYAIEERFQRTGTSQFNFQNFNSLNESQNPSVDELNPVIANNYTMTTPLKLGAGVSVMFAGLTVSGGINFSDFSQIRYSNEDVDLSDLNDAAKENLKSVLDWNVGAEYVIKPMGLILRGGYAVEPSPYKDDPSDYSRKNLTAGIGVLLSPSLITEVTYRRASYRTDHSVYSGLNLAGTDITTVVNADDVVQNQVMLSFSYRF
jgi:hypothetical protein